jgi:AraC-like DNA-binding protein
VETVRRYADTLPESETGWLAGLRDNYVARALALFHRDITRSWTVDELGREVGLSRSALGDRFTRLIGVAPMHYLTNWRMQVAAQELRKQQRVPRRSRYHGRLRVRGSLFHERSKGIPYCTCNVRRLHGKSA